MSTTSVQKRRGTAEPRWGWSGVAQIISAELSTADIERCEPLCLIIKARFAAPRGPERQDHMASCWRPEALPRKPSATSRGSDHRLMRSISRVWTNPILSDEAGAILAGHRLATSVGGTLTGRGGEVLIVDDPIKSQ